MMGRPRTAKCGTEGGYQAHRRRSESACQACRDALAAASRRRRQRQTEAGAVVAATIGLACPACGRNFTTRRALGGHRSRNAHCQGAAPSRRLLCRSCGDPLSGHRVGQCLPERY